MFVALDTGLFAEAVFACATAAQLLVLQPCRLIARTSCAGMPALSQVLRPLRAGRWKRLLPHARVAGAEPGHTPQGCRHPCVFAAFRLAQPFCTRPPDFSGAYHWASYYFLHRRRSSPRHPKRRAMASYAGSRAHRRRDSSVNNESSHAAPTALVELPTFNPAQQFFVFRPSTSRTLLNASSATPFTSHRRGMPSRRRPGQRPSHLGSSSSCCWSCD